MLIIRTTTEERIIKSVVWWTQHQFISNPATSHFGGGGGEFCDGDCLDSDDAAGRFRIVGIISNCADCQSAPSEKEVQCRVGELKAMGGALHESSDDVLLIYIYIYMLSVAGWLVRSALI